MPSTVYFGSPRQARLRGEETLPAKLDLILERLDLRQRVHKETVAIKIHSGGHIGYSVIHPVFVRKVVQAVKDGGGHPFVTDVNWDVHDAASRGYTAETLGCPIIPAAGLFDHDYYEHERPFKDLHDLAPRRSHPGRLLPGQLRPRQGAPRLRLWRRYQKHRPRLHDPGHPQRHARRPARRTPISFPKNAPTWRRARRSSPPARSMPSTSTKSAPTPSAWPPSGAMLAVAACEVAPAGSLEIRPDTFHAFQEACAISVDIALSTFAPGKATHLVLATHMTPVCDCFGFTGMPVLPDAGVFGSDDIVALDQAVLDATAARL